MGTATTASDVAYTLREHLRERITYLPDRKLHALLYLTQYLWLVGSDEPLFDQPILATAVGAEVQDLDEERGETLPDPVWGIAVLTAGRYGQLSAMDLEALIRGQGPWSATHPGQPIAPAAIRDAARSQDETPEGTINGFPGSVRSKLHPPFDPERHRNATPDSTEEREAFIAEVKARM